MRLRLLFPLLLVSAAPAGQIRLGMAEGRCRQPEPGPAILIMVRGLKDRTGLLRAELYPPDDRDFLADDNVLLSEHKVFRRVEAHVPASGPVRLCLRAPAPGIYALAVSHDRDSNGKFGLLHDGIGFAGNPRIGFAKPSAASARIAVGRGVTGTAVVMNYRHGFFSFGPLGDGAR